MRQSERRVAGPVFALATLVVFTASARAAVLGSYDIIDLGVLSPSASYVWGNSVNNSLQVVGYTGQSNGTRAFLYDGGVLTDLGPGWAGDINGNGQIAGSWDFSSACIWQNGSTTFLPTPDGYSSFARGLNAAGDAVGDIFVQGVAGTEQAALWHSGSLTLLGTLPGKTNSVATGINDLGEVCGYAYQSGVANSQRAFKWTPADGFTDLGSLVPDGWSQAIDISNSGFIVGSAGDGFRWSSSEGMLDLGENVGGYGGVNEAGQAVGSGYLWDNGTRFSLLSLLVNPEGWDQGLVGQSINDDGDITGFYYHNGQQRAFLMTPSVPEPGATLSVFVMLIAACRSRRWSSKNPRSCMRVCSGGGQG